MKIDHKIGSELDIRRHLPLLPLYWLWFVSTYYGCPEGVKFEQPPIDVATFYYGILFPRCYMDCKWALRYSGATVVLSRRIHGELSHNSSEQKTHWAAAGTLLQTVTFAKSNYIQFHNNWHNSAFLFTVPFQKMTDNYVIEIRIWRVFGKKEKKSIRSHSWTKAVIPQASCIRHLVNNHQWAIQKSNAYDRTMQSMH